MIPWKYLIFTSFSVQVRVFINSCLFKCTYPFIVIKEVIPCVKPAAILPGLKDHFSQLPVTACKYSLQYTPLRLAEFDANSPMPDLAHYHAPYIF